MKHSAILFLHSSVNSKLLRTGSQLFDKGNAQDRCLECMVHTQVFQFNQELEKQALIFQTT